MVNKIRCSIFVLVVTLLLGGRVFAQGLENYEFTTGTGGTFYSPAWTGLIGSGIDDGVSSAVDIGFTFLYDGVEYNKFTVNSNGVLRLGSTPVDSIGYDTPFSSSNYSNIGPAIVGAGSNLSTGGNGNVNTGLYNDGFQNIRIVQFHLNTSESISGTDYIQFQIQLFQVTNEVRIVYSTNANFAHIPSNFQIGIGNASGDKFWYVNPQSQEATYSTTNIETTYNVHPGTGRYYSFVSQSHLLTIGEGTTNSSYLPTSSYYNYSLTQQIYTPEEIGAGGTITKIAFYNGGFDETRIIDLYMLNSDKDFFSNSYDWESPTSNDLVYSGEVSFATNEWATITLTTPFGYDGASNLLIVVDDNTGNYTSELAYRVFDATNKAIRVYSDDTDYDPTNPSSYPGTVLSVKNQLQITIENQTFITPIVVTTLSNEINTNSATLRGSIFSNGNTIITRRGFAYGTDPDNLADTVLSSNLTKNFSYTIRNLTPSTVYYYRAFASNKEGDGYGELKSFATYSQTAGNCYGYAFVDLGLPSGMLWANTNVGAQNQEGYGDYFAWGEVAIKDLYNEDTYTYSDNPETLPADVDAATSKRGLGWRMPTYVETQEMLDNCDTIRITQNGVNGILFTSRNNGNSIFLPSAGNLYEDNTNGEGSIGCYWTSSYENTTSAKNLEFHYSDDYCQLSSGNRSTGLPIRGVFVPEDALVDLKTDSISDLTATTAVLHGSINDVQDSPNVSEYGFLFGTDRDNLVDILQSDGPTDDFTYSLTGLKARKRYYYQAYAINSNGTNYGEIRSFKALSGSHNGHDYVDLGLPSGTMWSTCNLGGVNPEDLGDYYAWGEVETKTLYDWSTYRWCNGSETTLTKYCNNSEYGYEGYTDNLTTLLPEDDAVSVHWGGKWRMPTSAEQNEIIANCNHAWISINNVGGVLYTSRINGNSIFIPGSGNYGSNVGNVGDRFYSWSNTIGDETPNNAYLFYYSVRVHNKVRPESRAGGLSVRGVYCPCKYVTNLRADVTYESATIKWTEQGTATSWEVILSEEEIEEAELYDNYPCTTVADSSYYITGLNVLTQYYVYIRAVCSEEEKGLWKSFTFSTLQIPATLPYSYGFENSEENDKWILANGNQNNQWYIGAAASNGGENGLYISNDDGTSNAYDNTATSYVYAYRTFEIVEDAWYQFDFDWLAYGESNWDLLRAFIVPTSYTIDLSAGQSNGMNRNNNGSPVGWIDISSTGLMLMQTEWQHSSVESRLEQGTYHLVFFWKNDNSGGTQPPAAIDNVSITKVSCPSVVNVNVSDITTESATISWTERGEAGSWRIIIGEEELDETELNDYENAATVSDSSYYATDLRPNTAYYLFIQAVCAVDNHSTWKSTTFNTPQIPTTVPYTCGFEDATENAQWTLLNEDQTNQWHIGTAASNGGEKGLYISNDNGVTNAYTTSSAESYVYAYRTIDMTVGDYVVSYDWKGYGYWDYDYMRVFLVPSTTALIAGNANGINTTNVPTGWIALDESSKLNQSSSWQNKTVTVTVDSAVTYNLVFYWRNSTGGTNPPASVDNISITKISCRVVADIEADNITTSSADITWTERGTASAWDVVFSATALTDEQLAAATPENVDVASYQATGLTSNTPYYIYVRAHCSDEDQSEWVASQFRTECDENAIPYSQDFNDYTATSYYTAGVMPDCWSSVYNGTDAAYSPHICNSTSYAPMTGADVNYLFVIASATSDYGNDNILILPKVEGGYANRNISFDVRTSNTSSGLLKLGYMSRSDFIDLTNVSFSSSQESFSYIVPDIVPADAKLAMKFSTSSSYSTVYFGIDNVVVRDIYTDNTILSYEAGTEQGIAFCEVDNDAHTISVELRSGYVAGTSISQVLTPNEEHATVTQLVGSDYIAIPESFSWYMTTTDTTLTFKVTAENGDEQLYTATLIIESCAAPLILAAEQTSPTNVNLSWTVADGTDTWNFYCSTTQLTRTELNALTASDYTIVNAAFVNYGVTAETTYYWYVRTECDGSYSSWMESSFTTWENCVAPTNVIIEVVNDNNVVISWNAVDNLPAANIETTDSFERDDINGGQFAYTNSTGNLAWFITSSEAHSGSNCLKSASGNSSSTSQISMTVDFEEVSPISFWYKVSSESGYDKFYFTVDGSDVITGVGGEVAWTLYEGTLNAGTHTLIWKYTKDGSGNSGSDCVWIDDITILASVSGGNSNYAVYRDDVMIATIPATQTNYTDESLDAGHYCYKVNTICREGNESDFSYIICQDINDCKSVTDLTVSNITANSATISWIRGSIETEWNLKVNGGSPIAITETTEGVSIEGDSIAYNLESLVSRTNYVVALQSDCGGTLSLSWKSVDFTTERSIATMPYSCNFEDYEENGTSPTMMVRATNTAHQQLRMSMHTATWKSPRTATIW
jgi:hypothetical protein